ncbi:Ig-like domain-containing protein [Vibrio sp. E150_018]
MFKKKSIFRLSPIILILSLIGCGKEGAEKESSSTIEESAALLAMDGFSVVEPQTKTYLDLTPFLRGNDIKISSVYPDVDNLDCGTPSLQGLGVTVDIPNGEFCKYSYHAHQTGSASVKASLNVLATKAEKPMLAPISYAMTLSDGNDEKLNLPVLFGEQWKNSYYLNADSVQVQGMGENLGKVTINDNNIIFTPPELSGWNRIIFTVHDDDKPDEAVMGLIYVTISEAINHPPKISEINYDFQQEGIDAIIGEKLEINLSKLKKLTITDPENQEWQLVSVQSFTATVLSKHPESTSNKTFTFLTSSVDDHYVSYIIADHYGGYTSGLMKIKASAKGGDADWEDIFINKDMYIAPYTYLKATSKGFNVDAIWDSGVKNTISGYTKESADLFCQTLGVIPSNEDIQALFLSGNSKLDKWPKDKDYLIKNYGSFKSFNLNNGDLSDYDASKKYYSTCLVNRNLSLNMLKYVIVANGQEQKLAEVNIPNINDSFNILHLDGSLRAEDVNLAQKNLVGTKIDITTTSFKSGTYRFRIEDANDKENILTSSIIDYIGNASTGQLSEESSLVINRNYALANGKDFNQLTATLLDYNLNPVPNALLEVSTNINTDDITLDLSSKNSVTDHNGQLIIYLKNKNKEINKLSVAVEYKGNESGTLQVVKKDVHFVAQNGYPCSDGTGNCIPLRYSTVKEGAIYAAPPHIEWVEKQGYSEILESAGYTQYRKGYFRQFKGKATCEFYNLEKIAGRTDWVPIMTNKTLRDYFISDLNEWKKFDNDLWGKYNYSEPSLTLRQHDRWPSLIDHGIYYPSIGGTKTSNGINIDAIVYSLLNLQGEFKYSTNKHSVYAMIGDTCISIK